MSNQHTSASGTQHTRARVTVPPDIAKRCVDFIGRQWVLDEVARWMEQRTERFLLIQGEPGSGKTALSAWLAGAASQVPASAESQQLARVRDSWDALHFCVTRGQGATILPGKFVESLACQLSNRYPEYAQAVIQRVAPENKVDQRVAHNWGKIIGYQIEQFVVNGRQVEDIYDLTVRAPLQALAESRPDWRCFILIDALDEALTYKDQYGVTIVTLLARSADLPAGVRFVITCRSNERQVLDGLDDVCKIDLSGQAQQADVRAYVLQRITAEQRLQQVMPADMTPEVFAAQLSDRSDENFLYAEFLLDELARGTLVLNDPIQLPQGLYGLYRSYLDRIITQQAGSPSDLWLDRYEPLLGSLSVAVPLAPRPLLPAWLGWQLAQINVWLNDVSQITECASGTEAGCRLYHRSMAEFLAAPRYPEQGGTRENDYFADPFLQHDRIIRYHLDRANSEWNNDWMQGAWGTGEPIYPLRQLVGHLQTRLRLALNAKPPKQKAEIKRMAHELYDLVLNPTFRQAQREWADSIHTVLPDLRTALEVALERDDLVPMLRIIAAYQETIRSGTVTQTIFDAVDLGDFQRAAQYAKHYGPAPRPRGRWVRVLHFYLAWEAAEHGQVDEALHIAAETEEFVLNDRADQLYEELSSALLARVARTLASHGNNVRGWLKRLAPNDNLEAWLLLQPSPEILNEQRVTDLERELEDQLQVLEQMAAEGSAEFISGRIFLQSGEQTKRAVELQDILVQLAGLSAGQQGVDRALAAALANPYPRYRDVMLVALGIATAVNPRVNQVSWVRSQLRDILRAGLDGEGVTFTFDLPAILLAEARRRGFEAPALDAYVQQALTHEDRWGTQMRMHSAQAAAYFWQGEVELAFMELNMAGTRRSGFAGYATVNLLMLANRCHEFGDPARAAQSVWGTHHNVNLLDGARAMADQVYDLDFRDERVSLVERYAIWRQYPAPDFATLSRDLAKMTDSDARRVYKDMASARWIADPLGNHNDLKNLLVIALVDTTLLDAVLGRLVGLRIRQHHQDKGTLSDDDLRAAIELCATHFTSGRPWELGTWK